MYINGKASLAGLDEMILIIKKCCRLLIFLFTRRPWILFLSAGCITREIWEKPSDPCFSLIFLYILVRSSTSLNSSQWRSEDFSLLQGVLFCFPLASFLLKNYEFCVGRYKWKFGKHFRWKFEEAPSKLLVIKATKRPNTFNAGCSSLLATFAVTHFPVNFWKWCSKELKKTWMSFEILSGN